MRGIAFLILFCGFLVPKAQAYELMSSPMRGWENDIVTLWINPSMCTGTLSETINKAIATWNAVPGSRIKMKLGGFTQSTGLSTEPIIECTDTFGLSDTVGTTSITTDSEGHIVAAHVKLNARRGSRGEISEKSSDTMDLAVTHELGHVLGLGHAQLEPPMMYYTITNKSELRLHQDDINGLLSIYGGKKKKKFLGCGSLLTPQDTDMNTGGGGNGSLLNFSPLLLAMLASLALGRRKKRHILQQPTPSL